MEWMGKQRPPTRRLLHIHVGENWRRRPVSFNASRIVHSAIATVATPLAAASPSGQSGPTRGHQLQHQIPSIISRLGWVGRTLPAGHGLHDPLRQQVIP